ncbi:unnamed protein product [Brachionus calyciflorus]|uniref:Uncharacterized protein n=1 Tax=Brachionus calyciflorus TaxID=104777 RepID=A0A813NJ63_9BILA|nr:unnamed protein product [Brachionus calyciflorus]
MKHDEPCKYTLNENGTVSVKESCLESLPLQRDLDECMENLKETLGEKSGTVECYRKSDKVNEGSAGSLLGIERRIKEDLKILPCDLTIVTGSNQILLHVEE